MREESLVKNRRKASTAIAAATAAVMLMTGCSGSNNEQPYNGISDPEKGGTPVFMEASVHDPSVVRAKDGTFYVFGSHLAAAKSPDLINWELVADGVADGNPLIPNVTKELRETLEWAETDTLWAADVIQLEDGKYYMYYNACRGDSPLSAMGVAVSKKIEGPYKDKGIILKSGMWGNPSEDGTVYDATVHPNVVDPDVFFDKDGKLWMVYGSYSGGIFIMEMNPKTGKPKPDQGYGKKLLGGNHSRIEGPFMQYSPDTDYYYLFLSYGGLDAKGGYNIRVARSKSPDGPFEDAEGNAMIDVKANPSKPLFDDESIEPYGVKMMGNHAWSDPSGARSSAGYVSPGHNSTYYDEKTGKYFLIFHARFPYRGEQHEIRVHEFYFNEEGWPVVSPFRYAGEPEDISKEQVPGAYELINHAKDISADIKPSVSIMLEADGSISGSAGGKWGAGDNNSLSLTIDGVEYSGVWKKAWDPKAKMWTETFSVLSKEGIALWGAKSPAAETSGSGQA